MARRQDGSIQSWNGKALHRTGIWLVGWLWLGMNALPAVVLTEIGIPDSGVQPYIELMNPGDEAIDLGGWLIQGDDSFFAVVLPADLQLPAGGRALLVGDAAAWPPIGIPVVEADLARLLLDAEVVWCMEPEGRVRDRIPLGRLRGREPESLAWERVAPMVAGDRMQNWQAVDQGTPGLENRHGGLPMPPESVRMWRVPEEPVPGVAMEVRAEIVWNGPAGSVTLHWRGPDVQAWNFKSMQPIGMPAIRDGAIRYGAAIPEFPAGVRVETYLSIEVEGLVVYWPPAGAEGPEMYRIEASTPAPASVVISEVMYNDPAWPGPAGQWLELRNTTGEAIELGGWTVSTEGGESYRFPVGTLLPANGVCLLAGDPIRLKATGGVPEAVDVVGPPAFELPNEGGRIALRHINGRVIDEARYAPGAPWPDLANGGGLSLERLDPMLAGTEPENWSVAGRYGGTPGAENTATSPGLPHTDVVIHEIMYAPQVDGSANAGDEDEEYVELFNRGMTAVALRGWSLAGGIRFTFESGILEPGGFMVVCRNPPGFRARYGNAIPVAGPYNGRLSNAGESVVLRNPRGVCADWVPYHDGAPWPEETEHTGRSLELRHPAMPNQLPAAWTASANPDAGGSPGGANTGGILEPVPMLFDIGHSPLVPASDQEVLVHASVAPIAGTTAIDLVYWLDGEEGTVRTPMESVAAPVALLQAGERYRGAIPAHPSGTIIGFRIEQVDANGQATVWPAADQGAYIQFEDAGPGLSLPVYRIVLAESELTLLRNSGRSNTPFHVTFIAGNEVRYQMPIRLRGKGDRGRTPHAFRITFPRDAPLGEWERMNLNGYDVIAEGLSLHFWGLPETGIPTPRSDYVYLVVNGLVDAPETGPRVRVEVANDDFLDPHFPTGEDGRHGNLYKGNYVSSQEQASFSDYGPDPAAYADAYQKNNNEELGRFEDVIELCRVFESAADGELAPALGGMIDLDEWARWFAMSAVVNNTETNLYNTRGDDFLLYHAPWSGRFLLMPWDQDGAFLKPQESPFVCTVGNMQRLQGEPAFAARYMAHVDEMVNGWYTPDRLQPMIDGVRRLGRVANAGVPDAEAVKRFLIDRVQHLQAIVNQPWTLEWSNSLEPAEVLIAEGALWRYFPGEAAPSAEPMAWTQQEFPDDGWAVGCSGFGYGDGDDCTLLEAMEDGYGSVFIRRQFESPDPEAWRALWLDVAYDDAFVAYLNGHEIGRRNVTGNPPQFDQMADSTSSGSARIDLLDVPDGVLVAGVNTLALQGHNRSLTSSDFSLIPVVTGELLDLHAPRTWQVLGEGAPIRYFKGVSEPDAGLLEWTQPGYADVEWPEGCAGIGYGCGDDCQVLDDMRYGYHSVYVRQWFELEDPADLAELTLSITYDDGFVAYLNGHRFLAAGVEGNPPAFDQMAIDAIEPTTLTGSLLDWAGEWLNPGQNLLAIQVHNESLNSSDLSMLPRLTATEAVPMSGGWAETPAGIITTLPSLRVGGSVSPAHTLGIEWEGVDAAYAPPAGTWGPVELDLNPGWNFFGAARNGLTGVLEQRRIAVMQGGSVQVHQGILEGAVRWDDPGVIHWITGTLQVPESGSLSIGPGVAVLFEAGSGFSVAGTLTVEGEPGREVLFTGTDPAVEWDGINVWGDPESSGTLSMRYFRAVGRGSSVDSGMTFLRGQGPCRIELEHGLVHRFPRGIQLSGGADLRGSYLTMTDFRAGALGAVNSSFSLYGSIVWACGTMGPFIYDDQSVTVGVRYSDVDLPDAGIFEGQGNFNEDPRFAASAWGEFRLAVDSPCIGAGEAGEDIGAYSTSPPFVPGWHVY